MPPTSPIRVVTGQAPEKLDRATFRERFMQRFYDPAFAPEEAALRRLEDIAWQNYQASRKSPVTAKAGPGHADPDYDLSVEWTAARQRIEQAQARQRDPATPSRVLLISGSSRNDGSCPGEMSKTWRLATLAAGQLRAAAIDVDILDLSLLTSEYQRVIHPCKGCVSTAMPLCHWPCSCYPNHALGQVNDAMNDIYERWAAAHGILMVTPTYWYQSPSPLKLMIDRLVCADGGNPDPTSTHGKDAEKAKQIELAGWDYPKHLPGRVFGLVVHGDVAGIEGQRRALVDWLQWMGLRPAGSSAILDRYIGYYKPYATSHADLDADHAVQEETRNAARALAAAIAANRAGRLAAPSAAQVDPRPK
ncbi:flavodoxin family protein [Achromobacter aloeverae]|uniref:NADPH-dependent FMN reductase n=1 Tax=Achromobacter aloeverae TaxID=1750518 RepID=A0A4Q1HP64_9BURK|nr:NAD(P)H-dependent oxidoreductase [Achromobacter aloeverae]RXN92699.1 NADPH-dependent FMN reductase [Achromobacter aloeverae]